MVVPATSVRRIYHYASEVQFWYLTRSQFRKLVSAVPFYHRPIGTGEIPIDDIMCLLNKLWHIQEVQKKCCQLNLINLLFPLTNEEAKYCIERDESATVLHSQSHRPRIQPPLTHSFTHNVSE